MRKKSIQKKFKLQERIDSLPYRARKIVMRNLPKLLEVSQPTAYRILKADVGDSIEISSSALIRMAKLFTCQPEDLLTIPVKLVAIEELEEKTMTVKSRFSLTK